MVKPSSILILFTLFTSSLLGGETHVIHDVWFDLADRYEGDAVFTHAVAGAPTDWKRVEFVLAMDVLSMRSFRLETNGTETLFDERFGDPERSTLIYHDNASAIISDRFKLTLSDAAEDNISPIQIMRLIEMRRDEIGLHIIRRHEDGTVTIGFSLTTNGPAEEHEFDVLDRKIVEYRSIKRNGKFISTIRYDAWQPLQNGQPVPTQIQSIIDTGTDRIVEDIRIESAHAAHLKPSPKQPSIPGSYNMEVMWLMPDRVDSTGATNTVGSIMLIFFGALLLCLGVLVAIVAFVMLKSRRASRSDHA